MYKYITIKMYNIEYRIEKQITTYKPFIKLKSSFTYQYISIYKYTRTYIYLYMYIILIIFKNNKLLKN